MTTWRFHDSGSPSVMLPPGDTWQCLETFSVCHDWGRGDGRGARDAVKYLTMHSTGQALSPLLAQIITQPQMPRVLRLRNSALQVRFTVSCGLLL